MCMHPQGEQLGSRTVETVDVLSKIPEIHTITVAPSAGGCLKSQISRSFQSLGLD